MSCGGGNLGYSLLVTISTAVVTYNLIVVSSRGLLPASRAAFDTTIESPADLPEHSGRRSFHTAVTASDSVYNTWQCRVMYYWFKRAREAAGPGSEMGGFTRILHSGRADRFVGEIPTFVADPLPPGTDQGYIVLNRPWAFVQWLQKADIQEEYILMAEPDHIIVNPIPNLSKDGLAAAFPFFYIEPKKYESVLRKFFPTEEGPVTNIDPIGNSPVIVEKVFHVQTQYRAAVNHNMTMSCILLRGFRHLLYEIAPTWMNVSLAMKKDPEADKAFGWVLEMYAYAVASAFHKVGNILRKDFMIQPPWDLEVGEHFIIHYTYGCDYDMQGKLTYGRIGEWRFDKRSYDRNPPPRNLTLPPSGVPQSVVTLVKMVNEATANIADWETYSDA